MSSTILIFCVTVSPDGIVLVSQGETHGDSGIGRGYEGEEGEMRPD